MESASGRLAPEEKPMGLIAKLKHTFDATEEDAFWRARWRDRAYARETDSYEQDWAPAYRMGLDAFLRDPDRHFDEHEADLAADWPGTRDQSRLEWDRARLASLDAWQRARDLALPPETDE
jgi:hypothetical protein